MQKIELRIDQPNAYVSIPAIFIDEYIAKANGEFVKVYLYLLRALSTGSDLSISRIADFFDHTEKDVLRAFTYWEKMGLLTLSYDGEQNLTGLTLKTVVPSASAVSAASVSDASDSAVISDATSVAAASASAADTAAPTPNHSATPTKRREYTVEELARFRENADIAELTFIIETYLKRPLTPTDITTLIFWYDSLHFPTDLIEYLVEYCITNSHSAFRYMDKVAMNWAEIGIDSLEKAKEQVAIRSKTYYGVMKAFGISGRNLADSESAFITRWTKEYGFDTEVIQEACKRTILTTLKPSFEYADKILANWHAAQVHNLKDIASLDSARTRKSQPAAKTKQTTAGNSKKNRFNNFEQRSYDDINLEELLLSTSID